MVDDARPVIESDLESNRIAELELVLEHFAKRLVDYAKHVDSTQGNVGSSATHKSLYRS